MEEEDDSKVYSSDSQMNMKHSNCVVYTSLYQKVDIKNYLLYNNMKYRLDCLNVVYLFQNLWEPLYRSDCIEPEIVVL